MAEETKTTSTRGRKPKVQVEEPKVVKELAKKMMFTKDVRVDPELNKQLWSNGVRNVAKRISVIMERKKNEDDDENEEKMYTLVKLAPVFESN